MRDIITNTIKKDCQEIAEQSVSDLTKEYLEDIHLNQLIKDKFITKSIKESVIDSLEEIVIEDFIDDMFFRLSKELAQPLATHMYE